MSPGPLRRSLLTSGIILFAAPGLNGQAVISGRVREDATGRVMPGVEVLFEGAKRATVTDDTGCHTLRDLSSANRVALFRFIGSHPVRIRMLLGRTNSVTADATMVPRLVRLEPLVVTGQPKAPR